MRSPLTYQALWGLLLFVQFALLPAQATPLPPTLSAVDLLLLNRITYGLNPDTINQYQRLGRERYLENQLIFRGDQALPPELQQRIAAMEISLKTPADLLAERHLTQQKIQSSPNSDDKAKLRQAINVSNNALITESAERRILRSVYSENQLQELLTWFWFNHFNVFRYKDNNNILIADYEEHAIRPHVLGKFRDLVMATLTHPAMLNYLDNAQNAAGASNENYARELMELHILGIHGGYTQQDVQSLAKILTGVGVDYSGKGCADGQTSLTAAPGNVAGTLFCFYPKRHDRSEKIFLGQIFPAGGGREEVTRAIDLMVKQPATAHYIAHELAVYLLSDNPPDTVVNAMAHTFQLSDGDIAQTLSTLFHSKAFKSGKYFATKYKDPVQYVVSAVRLLYGDAPIQDVRPVVNWINQLDEPLYEHLAPDGYGMRESDWLSADQMSKRFDIAKAIDLNVGVLYTDENAAIKLDMSDKPQLQALRKQAREDHPIDSFGIYSLLYPILSAQTFATLRKSLTMDEWNSLLLSSPEFMYR